MKKMNRFIIVVIFCVAFPSLLFALETDTHKTINEFITTNTLNGFSLDSYLKNQLGFINGVKEEFFTSNQTKKVWEWVQLGGLYEDIPYWWMPYLRSVNHFHNPLTYQGFSGIWGTGFLSGESSIQWSQKPVGTQDPGGHYSWHDVRDYFYRALTSTDKSTRETNFADTFRGLGQLMHLVEDLSVPEHTRDDGHYIFYNYEKWVKIEIPDANAIALYSPFKFFDSSAIGNPHPLASVPIANLFDSIQYNSTNPNITLQNNVGLSEYTNANFLSPDSYFTSNFPYPNWGSVVEYDEIIAGKKRTYLRKLGQGETEGGKVGNGEHIEHLALTGWLYKFLPGDLKKRALRPVFTDYAQKLIPRAVGYSAGLLNYFFRGTLEISAPDAYVYSIIDGSITPQQFTKITAKIRNSTPNEEIQGCDAVKQNCIIQAVARYKKRTDYQPDLSADPPTADSREADFSYSVSEPIVITSLSSTTPTEFTFDFTDSPIPVGITDLYLHVVFKGTLGNETDIAVAVGMKDLNEPDHHVLWNATDRFYLDGVLRTADEIRNDPELSARASGQYIDPYDITREIAFYPTTGAPAVYNATFTPLPPGRYGRLIILTDMPTSYVFSHIKSTNPPDEMTNSFLFSGATNQEIDGIFYNTQVITFRGIKQHHQSSYARYYPYATGILTAPWPVPANTDPYPATTLYP